MPKYLHVDFCALTGITKVYNHHQKIDFHIYICVAIITFILVLKLNDHSSEMLSP